MGMMTEDRITAYANELRMQEKSEATIEKYLRALRMFSRWLGAQEVDKERVIAWKAQLAHQGYAPVTINTCLSALNGFFKWHRRPDCCVSFLKVQRRVFSDASRHLSQSEYQCLVTTARMKDREQAALIMETICSTGMRVSELHFVTLDAVAKGMVHIHLKGKVRMILLPGKICKKLMHYAKTRRIASGPIFLNRRGNAMNRRQIWGEMKKVCALTTIDARKVFPHSLRHLFARIFYKVCRDVVRLADLLGHSSIETTRIYLITSSEEHRRQLESLRLIL